MILASSSLGPLAVSLSELIIGTIAFLIVFAVLYRVLFPRIQQTLKERTEAIEGGLEKATETQKEAEETLEQYRQQLAEARHEASRLRQDAQEQGAQILADMRAQGEAERERLVAADSRSPNKSRTSPVLAARGLVGSASARRRAGS